MDRPIESFASSKSGVSFFASHRLMWQCRPLPVRFANGFGMTVASSPRICASEWIMYRWKMTRSAVVECVRELEVRLELPVRVLVVVRVVVPAELGLYFESVEMKSNWRESAFMS